MHTDLRQDRHIIAERGIQVEQTLILINSLIEAMTPLSISHINFWPRGGEKNSPVIAMRLAEGRQRWLTSQALEGGGGIEQAPIKEHPTGFTTGGSAVGKSNLDGASGESNP